MCGTCGCGDENSVKITKPGEKHYHLHLHSDGTSHSHDHDHSHEEGHGHSHSHEHQHHFHTHTHADGSEHTHEHDHNHEDGHTHSHSHDHEHHHEHSKEIILEQNVLLKNDLNAQKNKGYFEAKNIFTINLVSSPGSGKTSLLERTIKDLKEQISIYVIEGDQQTLNDAERIKNAGAQAIQINTGSGCHLEADMVFKAAKQLDIQDNSVLVIENVGNLVCPSMFDLGENSRVVVISTTEGEDKPLKYPNMFRSSQICIINKTDLLPYLDFDVEVCKQNALKVNHHLKFFEISVRTGEGMQDWYNWLLNK